jgi:hypothetical protein
LDELDKEGHVPSSFRNDLAASLARLPPLVEAAGEKEKAEMLGQLKTLGNKVLGCFGLSTDNFQFTKQDNGGYSLNFVQK